jgi:hypothetical protein
MKRDFPEMFTQNKSKLQDITDDSGQAWKKYRFEGRE